MDAPGATCGLPILVDLEFRHLETAAKLLNSPERVSPNFSKCALKSVESQTDFDSAIPNPGAPASSNALNFLPK
jgi:hypothetical protein